jgi:ATP-dependent Clp protease ATP-binding subunit ClpA
MFERYTEEARRAIFFARYEASQYGSPYIETEHILLGVLRADRFIAKKFDLNQGKVHVEISKSAPPKAKVSTSVDLPLSNESKRVLAYAAEEAERLDDKHIGAKHLFLGLLREERSLAAKILRGGGVSLESVRDELMDPNKEPHKPAFESKRRSFWDVELLENGQPLPVTVTFSALPRTGDELVLEFPDGPHTYKVENVRFVLARETGTSTSTQSLEVVQIFVTRLT